MAISDGHGLPLAVHVASASPHETKLVEVTLEQRFLAETPERLIGDRAYDSDPSGRADSRVLRRTVGRTAQLHAQPESHTGRPRVAPLPASLEDRTSVRLAP